MVGEDVCLAPLRISSGSSHAIGITNNVVKGFLHGSVKLLGHVAESSPC